MRCAFSSALVTEFASEMKVWKKKKKKKKKKSGLLRVRESGDDELCCMV